MVAAWMVLSGATWAHGPVAENVSVQLSGETARIVATVPVSLFSGVDDDGDGLLSVEEVAAHRGAILACGAAALSLTDAHGAAPEPTLQDAVLPSAELDGAEHLTLMMHHRFPEPPEAVDLRAVLPDEVGLLPLIWKDTDTDTSAMVSLPPGESALRLRGPGGPGPAVPLWWVGVEHVLYGLDHLLFLVALVLATPRWRVLPGAVTAFTAAHTAALALVSAGLVPTIPGWIIEAGIAGSISALALLDLRETPRRLGLITGVCGAVHGLGFAGALSESLGGLSGWASALIELTLGVEGIQFLFAVACFGLLQAIRGWSLAPRLRQVVTVLVASAGGFWLVERVVGGLA